MALVVFSNIPESSVGQLCAMRRRRARRRRLTPRPGGPAVAAPRRAQAGRPGSADRSCRHAARDFPHTIGGASPGAHEGCLPGAPSKGQLRAQSGRTVDSSERRSKPGIMAHLRLPAAPHERDLKRPLESDAPSPGRQSRVPATQPDCASVFSAGGRRFEPWPSTGSGHLARRATRASFERVRSSDPSAAYCSLKLIVTVMTIGTGLPFSNVGVYSHCFTASSAA